MALVVKNPPANTRDIRDMGSIPGSGRFPGEGNGNPIQHSCLANPMDREDPSGLQSRGHKESDPTEVTWQSMVICV